jgi:hypothetical protein
MLSLMLAVQQERSVRFWLASGALCGVTGLFNPALLPAVFLLTAYTLFRTSSPAASRQRVVAGLTGLALVFSPWPIRNVRVFHALVLTRTTVGLELWMGNHPGATGFLEPSLFPTYNTAELAEYSRRGELGYATYKGQMAWAFIHAHPMTFILLSGQRFLRFWTGSGTRLGSALFSVHAIISSLLGCCGLYLLWRRGNKRVGCSAGIIMLIFPLPYYVTHAEFRYRLVLDPILTALAAPAVHWLLAKLQPIPETTAYSGDLLITHIGSSAYVTREG